MAKIYNEVIIDMNPESSTFEKVLHEDSYEYDGEMMLAQVSLSGIKIGSAKRSLKCFEYKMTGETIDHNEELEGWLTEIQA